MLLANDGVLPLDASAAPRIAVIGWRADQPEFQGGGSAQVTPPYVITPLQGITDRAGEGRSPSRPGGPRPGRRRSAAGWWRPIGGRRRASARLLRRPATCGDAAPHARPCARPRPCGSASRRPGVPGRRLLGPHGRGVHPGRVRAVDARRCPASAPPACSSTASCWADTTGAPSGAGLLGLFTEPGRGRGRPRRRHHLRGGRRARRRAAEGPIAARRPHRRGPPARPARRRRAGRAGRGRRRRRRRRGRPGRPRDRGPGRRRRWTCRPTRSTLIRQVAAANPRTIVVVNAASPVTMDWADDVAAVVQLSYLGQETGAALAAVLFGDADASGRLTTTYPVRLEDAPAHRQLPRPGRHRRVRRGRLRRLPPLRHPRRRPALVLRARPVVHDVRLLAARPSPAVPTTARRRGAWCRSTSPTPATAPAARSSRCTCGPSTPRSPARTVSSRRSRRSALAPGRDHHGHRRARRRVVRLLGHRPPRLARPGRHLRDPGRIVVPGDPPDRPRGR